jgi:flagellar motor component MotA
MHAYLPMKISPSRILGLIGVVVAMLGGFMLAHGNPLQLFVLSEWVTMLGVTWFALLATYGEDFINFSGDAIKSFFTKRPPNQLYVEIAESGSRFALGVGVISFLLGFIITLANIDGPILEIGHHVGSAMVGLFLAVGFSEILFPIIAGAYRSQNGPAPKVTSKLGILIAACMGAFAVLFLVLWIIASSQPTYSTLPKEGENSVHHEEEMKPQSHGPRQ